MKLRVDTSRLPLVVVAPAEPLEAVALEPLAEGGTIRETAFVVSASCDRVRRWARRAGRLHGGRRRFTPSEISTAVELVHGGATLREAGAAVGASSVTVLKWVREAR